MGHVLRPNYAQRYLLPPALDEWVAPTHPVRFVRDFVDSLDLSELGIEEPEAVEGRPPYAPDLLLKVWLFGYMERIRSTRGLEKACLQVMPFLWLTGNLHPDHNTLWRFFKENRNALPKIFKRLVKLAAEAELVGFVLHALDGTKMTAASSTDEALHRKGLEERLKGLDEFIASYMKDVNTQGETEKGTSYAMPGAMADDAARLTKIRGLLARRLEDREDERVHAEKSTPNAKESSLPQHTGGGGRAKAPAAKDESKPVTVDAKDKKTDEPAPVANVDFEAPPTEDSEKPAEEPLMGEAKVLKRELEAQLAQLDEASTNHLHENEPDARMMKSRGTHALGYNAQIVVDQDSDLIIATEVVTEQNDITQLVPMLDQVLKTLGRVAQNTVADTGYSSSDQLKEIETRGMSAIVAMREEPDAKGEYSKAYFRYEPESNVYVCPRGERIMQVGTNKSHATMQHPDVVYRCHNKTCPVRSVCSTDPKGRKIRRSHGEEAREHQLQKQKDPRMSLLLSLRKEIVEHLFGIVKGVDGFRRFSVRGLEKVRAQWALVCTALNLRKLYASWCQGTLTFGTSKTPTLEPTTCRAA
jgi:transposase/IS5 family transposase